MQQLIRNSQPRYSATDDRTSRRPRARHTRGVLCALAAGTACLTLAACGGGGDEQQAAAGAQQTAEVGYVVVQPTRVPVTTELGARTSAYKSSEVRPQVSGLILKRFFTEGSIVQKGDPLYQIDPRLYRASASQAEANLASARATEQAARVRADRYRPLAEMEAVSQQDYTDAAAQASEARAAVAQQRAALETAQINLRFTTVPAPITGRIGRSLFTEGALVTSSQADPLAVIQQLDPIYVDIQQSTADLLALRRSLSEGGIVPASAQVRLRLEDGSDYGQTGTVEFSEVVVDQSTGTVTLRARFPNPQGILLPGMFVTAVFAQAIDTDAYLVPQAGVTRDPKGAATVLVVGPGNKVVQRKVVADRIVGSNWVVTEGLKPGDKVIVQGTAKAMPGQPVRPVPAGQAQRIGLPAKTKEDAGAAGGGGNGGGSGAASGGGGGGNGGGSGGRSQQSGR